MRYIVIFSILLNILVAEEIAIIVNRDNPIEKLSIEDVKKIYENRVLTWGTGEKIKIYDLTIKNRARKIFSKEVLREEPEKVEREWQNRKITNSAKNPPEILRSSLLLQSKVSKNEFAIGYALKRAIKNRKVKIVLTVKTE